MEKQEFKIWGFGFRSEEALLDDGKSLVSTRSCNFGIIRDRAPSQAFQPASFGLRLDRVTRRLCLGGRQENHSESEDCGQLDARLLANQFVRDASQ